LKKFQISENEYVIIKYLYEMNFENHLQTLPRNLQLQNK
jgi:hypothetical protein